VAAVKADSIVWMPKLMVGAINRFCGAGQHAIMPVAQLFEWIVDNAAKQTL